MRCPHCASSRVEPPVCRICGRRFDEPVNQPMMPGLEITRLADDADVAAGTMPGLERTAVEATPDLEVELLPGLETTHDRTPAVASERMPGLITTEEAIGSTRIPDEPHLEVSHCPRCKVDVGQARFCPRCGYAVVPMKQDEANAGPLVLCVECGVPNPPGRKQCMSCGNRI